MKRILIALTAAALMTANVSAATEAELLQAAQKVQELVTEAKKAGLSQDQILTLVAEGLETNALAGTSKLTVQQKRNLMYLGLGLATAAVVGAGVWSAYHWHWFNLGVKKAETTVETAKTEAKPAEVKPATDAATKKQTRKQATRKQPARAAKKN